MKSVTKIGKNQKVLQKIKKIVTATTQAMTGLQRFVLQKIPLLPIVV